MYRRLRLFELPWSRPSLVSNFRKGSDNSVSDSLIDVVANLPKFVEGLKLLSQADPAVETFQQQTGEHVILTAGELHLEVSIPSVPHSAYLSESFLAMLERPTRTIRESRYPTVGTHCSL